MCARRILCAMTDVYEAVYASQPLEHTARLEAEGRVPKGLSGTLLRSSPGVTRLGGRALNFFDGHALIAGVSFRDGGPCGFRSRHVRTPLYEEEIAAGRMTKRRLTTNLPSRWANFLNVKLGNTAMHDVFAYGGRVFATNDPGHFALDAATLETIGAERWGGAVRPGWDMSPMPHVDPTSGRLIAWLKQQGGRKPDALKFVELDEQLRVVQETRAHALGKAPAIVHDLRATRRWYVATEGAPRLSVLDALWGKKTVFESFRWPEDETLALLLCPREGGDRLVRIPVPEVKAAFHVINAYDDGDHVVVDLTTYAGFVNFSATAPREVRGADPAPSVPPRPRRYVVDPRAGTIVSHRVLCDRAFEAPEVPDALMGARHRFAYGATQGGDERSPDDASVLYFGGVGKLDTDTGEMTRWSAGPGAIASPPAFVSRGAGEDEGWLLAWVLDGRGTSVVVLDALDLAGGPIARVPLNVSLPGVSHTRFAPNLHLA